MSILLDTNIVLRLSDAGSPQHAEAEDAILALSDADVELCVVPQVVYEFWSVATRPVEVNGLGMDSAAAKLSVDLLTNDFRLLRDERGVYAHWRTLVSAHKVLGKTAHDARLVAAMQRHGLTNLLTFNRSDFTRFAAVNVFTPADVLAGRIPA